MSKQPLSPAQIFDRLIAYTEKIMRTDRARYNRDKFMQELYVECLRGRAELANLETASRVTKNIGRSGLAS